MGVLADGVSTCMYSKQGAEIACSSIKNLLVNKSAFFHKCSMDIIPSIFINRIIYELKKEATQQGYNFIEYSSTLAGVEYFRNDNSALLFNLGDAVILGIKENDYEILMQPDNSQDNCCTTTTENADLELNVKRIDVADYISLFIMSDGLWNSIINTRGMFIPKAVDCMRDNKSEFMQLLDGMTIADDYSFVAIDF